MKSRWAYAYQMVPPQPSSRLGAVRTLLKDGTAAARAGGRSWSGRLVPGRRATQILIVSDASGRNTSLDRLLEAELQRLDAAFSVTEPLALAGHAEGAGRPAADDGKG